MKTVKYISAIGLAVIVLVQCKPNHKSTLTLDEAYLENLDQTRKSLNERRIGYLELCGLFKMNPSGMALGLNAKNQISITSNQIVEPIGSFEWNGEIYVFTPDSQAKNINPDWKTTGSTELPLNQLGNSEPVFYNSFGWRVITRSGALYLRVWDKNNSAIDAFKGFEYYKANPNFIFDADFNYFETNKSESVESKLGPNDVTTFVGQLSFEYDGEIQTLDVGENGWIMVGDQTSGETTYGAGRYMYIDLPEGNSKVRLDFNNLYNPPCRYSEFTTCLFPPRQNILPFAITAGELLAFKK